MKKVILGIFGLVVMFLASGAYAQPLPAQSQNVTEVLRTTSTCTGMSISNSAATNVIVSSKTGYSYISVESEDASASLFCNESPTVTTSGNSRGKEVRPDQTITWIIPPGIFWYCRSGGGAATAAMICRGR